MRVVRDVAPPPQREGADLVTVARSVAKAATSAPSPPLLGAVVSVSENGVGGEDGAVAAEGEVVEHLDVLAAACVDENGLLEILAEEGEHHLGGRAFGAEEVAAETAVVTTTEEGGKGQ